MKLSVVASDILGVSGRAMLAALIEGERDPEALAGLAKASLRNKHDALVESLTGRFDDHHAFLCQIILRRIDELTAVVEEVTGRIDTELAPFHDAIEHLVTIPGVDRKAAAVIIAETGADMSRFPSAGHLASWAGVCPGSHESGGIRKSGKTRDGNKPLGGALGTAALSAARTKNSYLSARYRRIVAHRGKQRAIVAVEHSILTAVWHMLINNIDYHDLGPDHFTRRDPDRVLRRITQQANTLGYTVRFDPIPHDRRTQAESATHQSFSSQRVGRRGDNFWHIEPATRRPAVSRGWAHTSSCGRAAPRSSALVIARPRHCSPTRSVRAALPLPAPHRTVLSRRTRPGRCRRRR